MKITNGDDILGVAGAHIHCAAAGANGPVVAFLAAPVPGGLHGKVDVGATVAELVDAMAAGDTYVNVHSPALPGGEVRGD